MTMTESTEQKSGLITALKRKTIGIVLFVLLLLPFFFMFGKCFVPSDDPDFVRFNPVYVTIMIAMYVGSLLHVFVETRLMREPTIMQIMHAVMVGVVVWPISYVMWLTVWPGTLRRMIVKKLDGLRVYE